MEPVTSVTNVSTFSPHRGAACVMGCEDNASHETYSLWYVGVILGIGASVCTNMGVNLQKYSFMRETKKPAATKRGYLRQPLWMLGLWLVIFGSLGDFGALGFIPQSLAVPVGGSTIVANVFFAHKFLHEAFSRRDGIGTALILTGIVVVAAFADKSNGCHTLDQLIALYSQPAFVVYVAVVCVAMVVFYYCVRRIRFIVRTFGKTSTQYKRFATVCSSSTILFAKSVAELVKSSLDGENQFTTVGTYAIALAMFACIFLQIHWLAQGLEHFDAVFVVPIFQVVMFLVGVVITLSGVGILSQRDMTSLKPKQKLRACVHMVIFMKRMQKCKGHKYQWVASDLKHITTAPTSLSSIWKLKSHSIHPVNATAQDSPFSLNVSAKSHPSCNDTVN
ncbi:hypothetical protein DYB25_013281 [Aphanomyces astaci]|uniref:Magnesium transporter n=1 Tax=Aphanomyces astaci TaxID=112090 RepID=A0A397BV51_APHAT|nr:hypothetical protein DYB25_013281 [Aphanomyces astaci]